VPVPDLGDPRAPYLQIADDLRKQIKQGRYKPGDQLPSNKALATDYTTSTETVRRALRMLADDSLIGTHSTLGTFVLRAEAESAVSPDLARMQAALGETEARLTRHIDQEIARLREELEYTQAQVMALGGGAVPQDRDVGT
jgi:GntR family transcriptional regulator